MGAVGSLTLGILLSLAFFLNLCKVFCSESTVYKTGKGSKQTIAEDQMPEIERNDTQQEILALFGLHQRPNPVKNNDIEKSSTQFMLDERQGMEPSRFNSTFNRTLVPDIHEINRNDLIMSFVNQARKLQILGQERDRLFYFNFSDVSPDEIVTTAELKLYKEPRRERKSSDCLIEIFRIRRGTDSKDKLLEPEANLTVSKNYEGWLSIEVTNAANYWTEYRTENLGLYMRVTDVKMGQEIDLDTFGIVTEDGPENKQLFMIGIFKKTNEEHVRPTRSARKRQNFSPTEEEDIEDYYRELGEYSSSRKSADQQEVNPECRRHKLYVNFRSIGWDSWIIAPAGYNAFYCAGTCTFPMTSYLNSTVHATVQSTLNIYHSRQIPKPCCVPTNLSDIHLLHHDQNSHVVLTLHKRMVVEACGCH